MNIHFVQIVIGKSDMGMKKIKNKRVDIYVI